MTDRERYIQFCPYSISWMCINWLIIYELNFQPNNAVNYQLIQSRTASLNLTSKYWCQRTDLCWQRALEAAVYQPVLHMHSSHPPTTQYWPALLEPCSECRECWRLADPTGLSHIIKSSTHILLTPAAQFIMLNSSPPTKMICYVIGTYMYDFYQLLKGKVSEYPKDQVIRFWWWSGSGAKNISKETYSKPVTYIRTMSIFVCCTSLLEQSVTLSSITIWQSVF